ncbi:MAG: hypothetical protein AAF539_05940 [Planctomycetota bacterium]
MQTSLIGRSALYVAACLVYFITVEYFAQYRLHPGVTPLELITTLSIEAIFWLPGLVALMPLMIIDMLRQTNRVAGPVFSLRRQMRHLADNKPSRTLSFRGNDYWVSMAEDFNALRAELLQLRELNGQFNSEDTDLADSEPTDQANPSLAEV